MVNQFGMDGRRTPLCVSIESGVHNEGAYKAMKLFIQNGADVNIRCGSRTPLHYAVEKKNYISGDF